MLIGLNQLWSDKAPNLYTCRFTVGNDSVEEKYGIRKIEWSNQGFFINGRETLLRGGCVHHDHGVIGAACYDESEWRRVRILKEAGFNAIRSAHNPCSRAMLEACDFYGIYVMDESFDNLHSDSVGTRNQRRDISNGLESVIAKLSEN